MTAGGMVVCCPGCDGRGFTLSDCDCRRFGDTELVVGDGRAERDRPAFRECRSCAGTGTVRYDCPRCQRVGRIRAQVVHTVINVDTGAVASAAVVPGVLPVVGGTLGAAALGTRTVLRALADAAGAGALYDSPDGGRPVQVDAETRPIDLPAAWRPHLDPARRHELEAAAIAGAAGGSGRWVVWWARSERPSPEPPTPAETLGRWCHLADALCLDLVVERRRAGDADDEPAAHRWRWRLRMEPAGTPLPPGDDGGSAESWLADAIAAHGDGDLLRGLRFPSRAPARFVRPAGVPVLPVDVDAVLGEVERDLLELSRDAPGAIATYRDGTWYRCALRRVAVHDTLAERATGQLQARRWEELDRCRQPPAPRYDAGPVTAWPCPDCDGTRHRCDRCGGVGMLRGGLVVTLTDLRETTLHLNWSPPENSTPEPASGRLDGWFRIARHLDAFGDRPPDGYRLTALSGPSSVLDRNLIDGTVPGAPPAEAYARYLTGAAVGLPGARLVVKVETPPETPLPELLRLVLGLGLHAEVMLRVYPDGDDPRALHGPRWSVLAVPPGRPVPARHLPLHGSLNAATADARRGLHHAVRDIAAEAGPLHAFPVPNQDAVPPPDTTALAGALRQIARGYATARYQPTALARFGADGVRLFACEGDRPTLLAGAPTLPAALVALCLPGH